MRFDWDDRKNQLFKSQRGYSFEEVVTIFAGFYVERMKTDDPEQFIAIGYLNNIIVSVIY